MQEVTIKYIINILIGTQNSQESGGRSGASLRLSAISIRSQKPVNLFLVLHLRQLSSIFIRKACNHQLLTG